MLIPWRAEHAAAVWYILYLVDFIYLKHAFASMPNVVFLHLKAQGVGQMGGGSSYLTRVKLDIA